MAADTSPGRQPAFLAETPAHNPARAPSSSRQASGATSPTGTVTAESPTKPSTIAPQSMLTMSPAFSLRSPGIPWTSSSLTLTVVTAGYGGGPGYPRKGRGGARPRRDPE